MWWLVCTSSFNTHMCLCVFLNIYFFCSIFDFFFFNLLSYSDYDVRTKSFLFWGERRFFFQNLKLNGYVGVCGCKNKQQWRQHTHTHTHTMKHGWWIIRQPSQQECQVPCCKQAQQCAQSVVVAPNRMSTWPILDDRNSSWICSSNTYTELPSVPTQPIHK